MTQLDAARGLPAMRLSTMMPCASPQRPGPRPGPDFRRSKATDPGFSAEKLSTGRANSVIIAPRIRKSLPEAVSEISVVPNFSVIAGGTNGRSSSYHTNQGYRIYSRARPARFDDDCRRLHDRIRHFYCLWWNL